MKNIDLTIIIVTFNSEDTITTCINSVLDTVKNHTYEIIISDNSENNLTFKLIKEKYGFNKNLVLIKNERNVGFSAGNNIAIKKARGQFVLFLNPDTRVYEKTIDGMIDFMEDNPECGASTCYVKLPNGKLDDASHRGFPTPWNSLSHFSGFSKLFPKSKFFGGYNLSYLDLKEFHEIDSVAGSFMLVSYNAGEKVGWWDEDFFFYGEDLDFCYRLKKNGYKIYFVPTFFALHMKGVSSGIKKSSKNITKATSETRKLATHHRFRAMEIFYDKHYKNIYSPWINALVKFGIKVKKMTVN